MTIYALYEDGTTRLVDTWDEREPFGLVEDPSPGLTNLRTLSGFIGFTRIPATPVTGTAALALAELQRVGEPMRNQEIATAIDVPPPTVHRALTRLAAQGRVERHGVLWALPTARTTEPTEEAIRDAISGWPEDEFLTIGDLADRLGCTRKYLRGALGRLDYAVTDNGIVVG